MRNHPERGIAGLAMLAVALVGIAGIVIGAGLVVGGVIDPLDDGITRRSTDSSPTSLLDCRGGDPIDVVFDGDEVFAVGQDVTGSWIAIRTPDDPTVLGWLPSSQLEPASDLTDLPEQPCSGLDGAIVLAADTTSSTTTMPDTTVTVTTQAPDTTVTVTTQAPDTTVTVTTQAPGTTVTQPPDTEPPILLDPLVMPSVIFPERCPKPDVTEGSAFLTIENETNVTATLSWSYLPPYYEDGDNSGSLPVEVLVDPANILLIGAISGLPDPYPFWGASAPEATIEFQWVVTDAAGNWNSATAEATVGRCP